jgi:hypothetical protein
MQIHDHNIVFFNKKNAYFCQKLAKIAKIVIIILTPDGLSSGLTG